ncbi:MAG TPA: hypothetical protein VFQ85_18150 [Mycobacteriales bacterium]|jgi:hypothetical protein|nr:hypothetical protein [Mycobacteriales bacterium]
MSSPRRALALVALAAAAVAASAFPAADAGVSGTRNDSLVTFTPATVVDPILFGGEPGINFDPTTSAGQRSFVDWPVSSRQNIGVLFRSEDGGLTYLKRYADPTNPGEAGPLCTGRQIPTCGGGGGGDTDVNIDEDGTVYFSSQESLADQLMGTSFDHGTTFPADHVDPVVSKCGPVDRQWITHWKGTDTVFLAYHIPAVGECINRSDKAGATGSWTIPAGPQIPFVTQSGAMIADNTGGIHNKTLYIAYLGGTSLLSPGMTVAVSTDGAATFVKHKLPDVDPDGNFTKVFMDRKGNLYATWVQGNKTMLSTSKGDDPENRKAPASKWSTPVAVSAQPVNISIFSDGVAGDPGRIAISYYGTTAKAPSPDDVKPGQGGWYPYVAVSTDALCQWGVGGKCKAPTFHQTRIAHRINQDDNICTAGTTCTATGGNRNLLDYFDISLDKQGHLGFVWTDTNNATKMGFIKVARQATGPSLYVGQPNAKQVVRGNGYADPAGDAKYPFYGAKIKTSKSVPTLDLRGTTVRLKDSKTLEVTMTLTSTSGLDKGVPGGGTGTDGATPIQQAKYLTRWDFGGRSFYAGANVAAGSTGDAVPAFFSGEVSNAEGVLAAGGGTTYYGNSYKPLTAAKGRVLPGKIVIEVPVSAVGGPKAGSRVYSVGSYAMLGPVDDAVVLNTIPVTVDSTPTFDTVLPRAGTKVTVGGPSSTRGIASAPVTSGGGTVTAPGTKTGGTGSSVTAPKDAQQEQPVDAENRSLAHRVMPAAATGLFLAACAGAYLARRRRAVGPPA